jgi:ABC-type amino acid transport substrate-binding protein
MRSILTTALIATLLVPFTGEAGADSTLEQIASTGKIRIGFRQSVPPMSFRDNAGNPVGYSIDLCSLIFDAVRIKLGNPEISVDFLPVNSENRFTALAENKIDILCGATTKTLARGEIVDFTQLTFATGASLMSRQDEPVNTVEELEGKKVGVAKGTTTEKVLADAIAQSGTGAEIVLVDSAIEGFDLLKNGEIAAFSADQVVLIGLLFTADFPRRYGVSEITFSYEPFALAVRRNDADFRLLADRVLSRLYRTGQIIEVYERWFGRFSSEIPGAIAAVYQINATPE